MKAKKFLALAFLALLVAWLSPLMAAQNPTNYPEFGHQPTSGGDAERIKGEIARLELMTAQNPSNQNAWLALGRDYETLAEASSDRNVLRKAAATFERVTEISVSKGKITGTYELSIALTKLRDRERLDTVFKTLLAKATIDPRGHYLTLVDYARALSMLNENSAEMYFKQAIREGGPDNIEAINSYSRWLVSRGRDTDALDVLDTMPQSLRVRFNDPAVLRNEIIDRLGAKEAKDHTIQGNYIGISSSGKSAIQDVQDLLSLKYIHSNTGDDCRLPGSPITCLPYGNRCYYNWLVNLAEVMYNEARSERRGAIDMVGWTVRDRVYQGLRTTCNDSYVGGFTSSCWQNMQCSDPNFCEGSQRYCCALHGATFTVGASQKQFDDTHVIFSTLGNSGLLNEAFLLVNGLLPEPSTQFVPPGVSGCTFGCDFPSCSSGFNSSSPSPSGPMEFMGIPYTPSHPECKTSVGAVCGNGSGENYFWNRKP